MESETNAVFGGVSFHISIKKPAMGCIFLKNERSSLFLMKSLFNKMCCLPLITHCPKMLFLLFLA